MTSTVRAALSYDTLIPTPVCAKFKTIKVEGTGEFVNTDNSAPFPLTTGDMSISASFTALSAPGSYPNQSYFRNLNLEMNAICVVTEDQPLDPATGTAPTCFYEAQLGFCRRFFYVLDVEVVKELVPIEKVIDVVPLLEKYEQELGLGRRTQQVRRAQDAAAFENVRSDKEKMVEAVFVTDELYKANSKLMEYICPQKYCWIPYCIDTRSGGFTAHGTGNQDLKITGGTGGLFGAFGQITGTSPINISNTDPNGDITYDFDMDIEICYYRRELPSFF